MKPEKNESKESSHHNVKFSDIYQTWTLWSLLTGQVTLPCLAWLNPLQTDQNPRMEYKKEYEDSSHACLRKHWENSRFFNLESRRCWSLGQSIYLMMLELWKSWLISWPHTVLITSPSCFHFHSSVMII